MKIAHVNFAKGFRGGERQTELLIKSLSDLGVQQILVARSDSPLIDRLSDVSGLEIMGVKKPYFLTTLPPVDLVHAHEAKAGQWAYLNSKKSGVPYIITRRVMKTPKNNPFTKAVYKNAEKVVCLSQAIAQSLAFLKLGGRIEYIGDMAASLVWDEVRVKRIREMYQGKVLIGQVGALSMKDKGQQISIDMVKQFPADSFTFLFIGDGPDREELEELAKGIENIQFLGFQDDVGSYIRALDIFVYPSLSEGFGSSILDSMQAEVAVIASKTGGIPEVVTNGVDGLLFEPGSVNGLKEAVEKLLIDDELAHQFTLAGAKTVTRYLPQAIGEQYFALYHSIFE